MTAVSMKTQRRLRQQTAGHMLATALKYIFLLALTVVALVPFA